MGLRSIFQNVPRADEAEQSAYWFVRHAKTILFLIATLAAVGGYLAFTLPVAVFPPPTFRAS